MTVAFSGWAILELMGHRRRAGFVEEVEIAGGKLLRVDIHGDDDQVVTEFYGCSSIFSLRPVAEEIARDWAKGTDLRPVRPVEYRDRPQLPSPSSDSDDDEDGRPF
ncbi:MAG TPA: hypothetical protein VFT56_01060 [Sphingomonas sp.]|nr:hypothetical protein [Sphingomonas sp.]